MAFLTAILIGIDVVLAGLFWALAGEQNVLGQFIKKVLYVGAFAFIINNFALLANIIFLSFAGLGLVATGGSMTPADLMQPGFVAATGYTAAYPLLEEANGLLGFPSFFNNFVTIMIILTAWIIVLFSFFILAIQLFVTIIEFKLTTLAGFVLVPFALWNKTSFLAERVLGNVVASGVKLMVLAIIVGIGSTIFGSITSSLPEPASIEFIRWLHLEFYRDAPEEMLRIRSNHAEFLMVAGEWRSKPEHDVSVGRHIPPSSDRVADFMTHFEKRFHFEKLGQASRIMAMATAHHRLNYIHPFPDGNGRVSRLMSHAMAAKADIGAYGLWSISRGLARGLESRQDYKRMMDYADTPRQGDLDGRGNLSLRTLTEFTSWFLKVCLDQIAFMSELFDLDNIARRFERLVERDENLKPEALSLLLEALHRGQYERGEAPRLTGLPERTARRVLNDVVATGLLASETPKGPVSLRFPSDVLETLFPRLYPEA